MTQNIPSSGGQRAVSISSADFLRLGLDEVAYIKRHLVDGKAAWVLHAADGTALAVQDTANAAQQSAHHYELNLVTIH